MFTITKNTDIKIFDNVCNIKNQLKEFIENNIGITVLEVLLEQSESIEEFTFTMIIFYEKNN